MLKVASISDIHLGHRRNKTVDIIAALNAAFPDNAETAELDAIFMVGDVFDRLLDLSDPDIISIHNWFERMCRLCAKHSIVLVVLEGTPRHDWKQCRMFAEVARSLDIPLDMRYITDLRVEYIESLNIHLLCVPDEWDPDTSKTLAQAKAAMKSRGIDQVDFSLIHGQFPYQLPGSAPKDSCHDPDEYLNLTRHLIFVGHIHIPSSYDRIYAQGSFDRLSHGEEEAKGHLRAQIEDDGTYYVQFVENRMAKRYISLNCSGLSLEQIFERVKKRCTGLPNDSYVRIDAEKDNPILTDMTPLIKMFPTLNWGKKPIGEVTETQEEDLETYEQQYTPITITRDNVTGLVMDRIVKRELSPAIVSRAEFYLQELR
jgi:hypothetical protein